jgi:hypothetical protein
VSACSCQLVVVCSPVLWVRTFTALGEAESDAKATHPRHSDTLMPREKNIERNESRVQPDAVSPAAAFYLRRLDAE